MEKQIATKPSAELAATTLAGWGSTQEFTSRDIVIPKLVPLNFMSEKVKNNQGKYGELRDTLNNEKFGDIDHPVEFIPFYIEKTWMEFDVVANKAGAKKREFKQVVKIDHTNDALPYVDEAKNIERDRVVNVYCLIPSQIEAGNSFPYVLPMRRTSLKAGNKVITQIMRNERMGLPPAAVTMLLTAHSVQNDNGEYVVLDTIANRKATTEEMNDCLAWYKMVASGATKLDDSDYHEEAPVTEKVVSAPGKNEKF